MTSFDSATNTACDGRAFPGNRPASGPSHPLAKVMTAQFLAALSFAAYKHRHQRRKDVAKTPYINHPIDVANILLNEGGITDEWVLIAALLHDTVEDTETTFEEIEENFGRLIREIVSEVTDDKSLPQAERKQRQIDHAPKLSDRARLVKIADKISNIRDTAASPPAGWPIARIVDYLDWGKAVIATIRGTHPQLETLFDRAYAEGIAAIEQMQESA